MMLSCHKMIDGSILGGMISSKEEILREYLPAYILHIAYLCSAILLRVYYSYIFSFHCNFLISIVTDMLCQLFVRVSNQHESLCFFGL